MREEICRSFEWKGDSSAASLLFSILLLTEVASDRLGLILDLEKREWSLVISVGPNPSDQSK